VNLVFGRKQQALSQRQQMLDELSQGYGHLRKAATHFASDTSERLAPSYDRARVLAGRGFMTARDRISPAMMQMRPMYEQMKHGAMNARNMEAMKSHLSRRQRKAMEKAQQKGMGPMTGLLVAGAALGAASAIVARRRRAAQWHAYDMAGGESAAEHYGYDDTHYGQTKGRRFMKFGQDRYGGQMGRGRPSKMTAGAASMADTFAGRAGRVADNLHERANAPERGHQQGMQQGTQTNRAPGLHGPHANGPFGPQGRAMSGAAGRPGGGPSPMPSPGPGSVPSTGPTTAHGVASGSDMRSLDRSGVDRPISSDRMPSNPDYPTKS
jgi:hypothetical protein